MGINKKALLFGVIYSIVVVAFKFFILKGGYSLTRFGYFYSGIIGVFLIIPFYILAIKSVRDKTYNGIIGGREAMRVALTIFAVSAVLISIYNYYEFEYYGKAMAIEYYNSIEYLDFLKAQKKLLPAEYPKIISEQIKLAEVSAFKATTGKLFSFTLIGLSGAFIVAMFMKRNVAK